MADNVIAASGDGGGPTFATHDAGGVHHSKVVIEILDGAGSAKSISSAAPLPISGRVVIYGSAADHLNAIEAFASATSVGVTALQTAVSASAIHANINSAPAADRTTDNIGVALMTDALMDDVTVLTPQFAKVSALAAGNTEQVAKVAAKKLRVIAYDLTMASGGTVQWVAGSGGGTAATDLTGAYTFPASGGGISKNGFATGYFETHASGALQISAVGGGGIGGVVTYVEV